MTGNNKRANDATRRRRREAHAKRSADKKQEPPTGKFVGGYGRKRNPKTIGVTLARITMGSD
jgi:hypothetical protein